MFRLPAILLTLAATTFAQTAKPSISIAWFDWQPCQALKSLASTYPDATVSVNCVNNADWHSSIWSAFSQKKGADLVILDSQWIGEAVQAKHIQDITQWMQTNLPLDDFLPAALSAYGEYPLGSGRMYGVAAQADTQVLIYRKDLFTAARFQLPSSWSELLRQAQYFRSTPSTGVRSGFVTHWCASASCYDQVQTAWNEIAWSFGGELWDPIEYRMVGVLDSPANVRALEFARELVRTGPENATAYQFTDVVDAMCTGRSAMATIWFGFAAAFTDAKACPQSANLGYAIVPGEQRHYLSLGGMGISLSSYSSNSTAALQFVKWFQSDAQQLQFARLGGSPARRSILASDTFAHAAPYNAVFAASYDLVKDFWDLPEYYQLLPIQGELLNLALSGKAEPEATLSAMASLQQRVLDTAYPNGSPLVPAIAPAGVVNGASFLTGAVAPGEVVTIFGTAIGAGIPASYSPSRDRVGAELAGTRVFFDGVAAPVLFTGPSQITAVVPQAVAGKANTAVRVETSTRKPAAVTVPVVEAAPAIFTTDQSGKGQALALNDNGARNGATSRARKGDPITFFVTGVGVTNPAGVDGAISGSGVVTPALPISVTIGGAAVNAVGVLNMPGLAPGLLPIQVRVPAASTAGTAVPITLRVGTATSAQIVTVAIEE
jgi:uncharacterized protein (TIGR03437 family)